MISTSSFLPITRAGNNTFILMHGRTGTFEDHHIAGADGFLTDKPHVGIMNRHPISRQSPSKTEGSTCVALNRKPGLNGSVLVPVLAVLGTIVVLVAHMQSQAFAAMRHADALAVMTRLQLAAADTAQIMLQRLADDDFGEGVNYNQDWAKPLEMERADGVRVSAAIYDEQAAFDVNNLAVRQIPGGVRRPEDVLSSVLSVCGDAEAVLRARAVRAHIHPRESALGERNEVDDGRQRPVNAILTMGELADVNHWSRDYLSRPLPSIDVSSERPVPLWTVLTVGPGRADRLATVNINTASREVLLGILGQERQNIVDLFLDYRERAPLNSLIELRAFVPGRILDPVSPYLDVYSTRFRLEIEAWYRGRYTQLLVWAERNSDGAVQITGWVE